jgi:hypothetical protein
MTRHSDSNGGPRTKLVERTVSNQEFEYTKELIAVWSDGASTSDSIFHLLHEIAIGALSNQARDKTAILLRAHFLIALTDPQGDLVHELASRLARDIVAYLGAQQKN